MEKQASSKSIILNYGLYYGIISVLISVVMYALGQHLEQGMGVMFLGFAVMIAFIILGIKKFKGDNSGLITWGQSVKIGVGIIVIGVLIALVYQQLFINFVEPDFMQQVNEKTLQSLVDSGLSSEQIDAQMGIIKKMQTPLISSAITLAFAAFLAFVFSAIAGAVMKETEGEQY